MYNLLILVHFLKISLFVSTPVSCLFGYFTSVEDFRSNWRANQMLNKLTIDTKEKHSFCLYLSKPYIYMSYIFQQNHEFIEDKNYRCLISTTMDKTVSIYECNVFMFLWNERRGLFSLLYTLNFIGLLRWKVHC